MNSNDGAIVISLIIAVAAAVVLAWLPGAVARSRKNKSADAVSVCGWLSLLFPILWPVALIWSFVGDSGQRKSS